MWVQLCINSNIVFVRATKTHWYYPDNSTNMLMLVISPNWRGINHSTQRRHTKCSVLHSGQVAELEKGNG